MREVCPAAAAAHSPDRVIVVQWQETAAAEALLTALMPLASWSVAAEHGREADSRHSGTAGTRVKGVDAAFMLLERNARNLRDVTSWLAVVAWQAWLGDMRRSSR